MLRYTVKSVWDRNLRLGLSALAIVFGVGAVSGTFVLTDSANVADAGEDLDFVRTLLGVVGGLALLVGGLVIHNAFSITVAQRVHDLALLRCLGADRRQVRNSVLLESTLVGGVMSLGGLVAGIGLAFALRALLGATGEHLPIDALVIAPRTVTVAVGLGLAVTILSSLGPARYASRIAPIAALRAAVPLDRGITATRSAVGGTMAVGGTGLLSLGIVAGSSNPAPYIGGAALAVLAIVVLGPVIATPLARFVGLPFDHGFGLAGTLARQNAARDPRRTAATATALMVGLMLLSLLVVLAESTRASVGRQIDRLFPAEYLIQGPELLDRRAGTSERGLVAPEIISQLENRPDLATVAPLQTGGGTVEGEPVGITAADPRELRRAMNLDVVHGNLAELTSGTVGISQTTATAHGWTVGSSVALDLSYGSQTFTIGAIYDNDNEVFGVPLRTISDYLLVPSDYQRLSLDRSAGEVYLRVAGGETAAGPRAAIGEIVGSEPALEVLDHRALRQEKLGELNEAVRTYSGLLAVVVFVALFGVVNTMALSVVERRRELGMLRAIGMDRAQLRTMICWEATIIAAMGAVLGAGLGTLFGWALVRAFRESGLRVFSPPVGHLAVIILLVSLLGVLAAVLPARQAARVDVLRAIATD